MWLITTFVAALIVTAIWIRAPKRYKLDFLALMLWGLSIMVLVDRIQSYKGGPFIEMETTGLITSGTMLGIAMLVPVFIIWGIYLIVSVKEKKITG